MMVGSSVYSNSICCDSIEDGWRRDYSRYYAAFLQRNSWKFALLRTALLALTISTVTAATLPGEFLQQDPHLDKPYFGHMMQEEKGGFLDNEHSLLRRSSLTPVLASASSIPLATLKGKAQVAYYANWDFSVSGFTVKDIPVGMLSHINYAFANVDRSTGEVILRNSSSINNDLLQLFLLKTKNRHLKVLLSIGGASFSPNITSMLGNSSARANFARTAVRLLNDGGFDGIDIDWELSMNTQQAADFTDLVRRLRAALNDYAMSKKESHSPYLISIASMVEAWEYKTWPISAINKYVDLWNLMAYEFKGPWSSTTGYNSNLYGDSTTQYSIQTAIKYYISQGVGVHKIILGIPLFGISFENTMGINMPFNGVGPGSLSPGRWQYNLLPLPGATVYYNRQLIASYSYDPSKKELIVYDSNDTVYHKVLYVNKLGLGGVMFWEISYDYPISSRKSLVRTSHNALVGGLDMTLNHVHYPTSRYITISSYGTKGK